MIILNYTTFSSFWIHYYLLELNEREMLSNDVRLEIILKQIPLKTNLRQNWYLFQPFPLRTKKRELLHDVFSTNCIYTDLKGSDKQFL